VNQPVQVGESGVNGGLWYKATSGSTTLTKSAYDPLTQAKDYTDTKTKNISEDSLENLDTYIDKNFNVYRHTDKGGNLFHSQLK
jgi:hypothetical protein